MHTAYLLGIRAIQRIKSSIGLNNDKDYKRYNPVLP